jgi:hypothetical protein
MATVSVNITFPLRMANTGTAVDYILYHESIYLEGLVSILEQHDKGTCFNVKLKCIGLI